MNNLTFATGARDPWCPGCGHSLVIRALHQVLSDHYDPNDVVLVTDIGCIGMADGLFTCHTVHGLHGRAPALAAGIAFSAPRAHMKVVALMGDGGAAIGLQHVLEGARLNVDVTIIVCNNQNYGMTGGQQSACTLPGVRTATSPEGAAVAAYDLCRLLEPFSVPRARVLATARARLRDALEAAVTHRGFSFVETMNWCPSYTGKMNPEDLSPRGMEAFFESRGVSLGSWPADPGRDIFRFRPTGHPRPMSPIPVEGRHALRGRVNLLLAGSAGKGVQSAAGVFARAAMGAGLHVAVRGEYPVTVGRGFSASYVILSEHEMGSPAADRWDLALAVSQDGLSFVQDKLPTVDRLVVDSSLPEVPLPARRPKPVDPTGLGAEELHITRLWLASAEGVGYSPARARSHDETEQEPPPPTVTERVDLAAGKPAGAAFAGLVWALRRHGWFPEEQLRRVVEQLPGGPKRDLMLQVLEADGSAAP